MEYVHDHVHEVDGVEAECHGGDGCPYLKPEAKADALEQIRKLTATLEAGGYNAQVSPPPAPLVVVSMVEKFPTAWSEKLKTSFKSSIKSLLYQEEVKVQKDGEWDTYRTARPCQFLSRSVASEADLPLAAKVLAAVLEPLVAEGHVIGYLAPPSYIELTPGQYAAEPVKTTYSVFCFLFTRLSEKELLERCGHWASMEGSKGNPLVPSETSMGVISLSEITPEIYAEAFRRPPYLDEEVLPDDICVLKTFRGKFPWPAITCQADVKEVATTFAMELDCVEEIFLTKDALERYKNTFAPAAKFVLSEDGSKFVKEKS